MDTCTHKAGYSGATDQMVHGLGNVGIVRAQLCLVDLQGSLVVILHLETKTTTSDPLIALIVYPLATQYWNLCNCSQTGFSINISWEITFQVKIQHYSHYILRPTKASLYVYLRNREESDGGGCMMSFLPRHICRGAGREWRG